MTVLLFAVGSLVALANDSTSPEPRLTKPLGHPATQGAAPGYIADAACATCHADHQTTYQHVGMAKSFTRPRADVFIEDFDGQPYFHAPSRRYYRMTSQGDRLLFKRYQLDGDGKPINVFEREVDWIMGSGHKTRVYLYRTATGELYQLPIAWYAATGKWGMAPGYDRKDHDGVLRPVRRECMFCHNAYPDVPAGSDVRWQPHRYPKQLPEGTGCQRCHGPGAEHVRVVLSGSKDMAGIRASIVNPARLPPERRDGVCYQCHLLPAVALIGARRFDRADYSFRPGESPNDYMLHVDIDANGQARGDRFEINHHAYRFRQSACVQKSAGALGCITCHDPHRKVAPSERAAHYSAKCLGCHQRHEPKAAATAAEPDDCVSCHMPQRRTQDVVQVVMTDHRIQRHAAPAAERLAPLAEIDHVVEKVDFLIPEQSPTGALGEIYKAVTLLRARTTPEVVERLASLLATARPDELAPYFDLAQGYLNLKRYREAERTLDFILARQPGHAWARQWLGIAYLGQGQAAKAEAEFQRALKEAPDLAEVRLNLGLLMIRQKRYEDAAGQLRQAVALRSNMAAAWFHLGQVEARLGRLDEAVADYRRALEIDPAHTLAYQGIARALLKKGDRAEARRFLEHGATVAGQPEAIGRELAGGR